MLIINQLILIMNLSTTFASLRKQVAGLSLVALVAGLFATGVATAATSKTFSDVPADAWYADYVTKLADAGVVDATKDMYRPGDLVNRAEMAKFAFMVSGLPMEKASSAPYSDVAMGQWYTDYIYTLTKNGVVSGDKVNGVPTGKFRPMDSLNRAEATKMLVNAAQMAEDLSGAPHFPDVKSSDWFYNFVETAFNNGLVAGYPDGNFRPANNINRAEAAKMVYLAMNPVAMGFSLDSAAAASSTKVEVIFSMNVDKATAETVANYMIEDSTGNKLNVTAATMMADDTVHLTTAAQTEGKVYYVTAKNVKSEAGDDLANTDSVSFLGYGSDVSGGDLKVSLSTETPVAGSVPSGATGVVFTCWDFKAGSSATVVKSLHVHRVGPGSEDQFQDVYLYRGDSRLTTGRSINNETQIVEFNNINQTVAAGENAKLCLVGDLKTGVSGGVHAFELLAADSVMSNSSNMTGSFPLRGADQLITTATVGSLAVKKNGSLDEVTLGQVGARIAQFELAAGSEELVKLKRLSLYVRGTVSRGDLKNFKLYTLSGEKLAEVADVNSNDLAVFSLSTPYTLAKGESKIFYVTADVVGARNGDTVKSYIDESTDVFGMGGTYGYGVRVGIAAGDTPVGSYDGTASSFSQVSVKGSDFTIISNPVTATEVAVNQDDAVCLDLSLTNAAGSELTISDWMFKIEGSGVTVDKDNYTQFKLVKLNEDGTAGATMLGSNELSATGAATQDITLTGDYTIPSGSTVRAGLVFDVEAAAPAGNTIKCSLYPVTTGERVVDSNNDELGESAITPNSIVGGNTLDVVASQLTVTRSTAVQATSYTKGTSNANLLALQFKAGSAQSQTIKEVKLAVNTVIDNNSTVGNDVAADFNNVIDSCVNPATAASNDTCTKPSDSVLNVQLMDGATVLATENVVNASATTGLGEINFRNLTVPVAKDATKVLTVRAFLNTTADAELIGVYLNGADSVVAIDGQGRNTTGIDVTAIDNVSEAPVMKIATPSVTGSTSSLDTFKYVVAAEETFETLRFKLRSNNGDTTLQDLTFAVSGNVEGIKAAGIHKLTGGVCGPVIKVGTVDTANYLVNFDNVGITLTNNQDTTVCVSLTNNTIAGSSSLFSGDYISLYLTQNNLGVADADGEITDLRDSTNTNIASSASLTGLAPFSPVDTYIYRSIPVLTKNSISSVLSSGTIELANITLGKTGENLDLTNLHFTVSATGISGILNTSCKLYNGVTLIATAQAANCTTTNIEFVLADFGGTGFTVDSTKTLSLKADVTVDGAAQQKSLGITLPSTVGGDVIEWNDGDSSVTSFSESIIQSAITWSLN